MSLVRRFTVMADVTHGVAKLALPVKASLDTPKQIAVGLQSFADIDGCGSKATFDLPSPQPSPGGRGSLMLLYYRSTP